MKLADHIFTPAAGAQAVASAFTRLVDWGWQEQSNGLGSTFMPLPTGEIVQAAITAPSQGYFSDPLAPAMKGSYLAHTAELLAARGIRVRPANGSLGGASFIREFAGFVTIGVPARATSMRARRASQGAGDPGTKGHFCFVNGVLWECTTGQAAFGFFSGSTPISFGGASVTNAISSVVLGTPVLTSAYAVTFPLAEAVTLGDTVSDGAVVWTAVSKSETFPAGAQFAGMSIPAYNTLAFDPFYACKRLADELLARPNAASSRFVTLANAQSDTDAIPELYTRALAECVRYYRHRSIIPIVGLSGFWEGATLAQYNALETVINGTARDVPANPAAGALAVRLEAQGYRRGTPGTAFGSNHWYVGPSVFRLQAGIPVAPLMQPAPNNVHTNLYGATVWGSLIADGYASIFLNQA